MPEQKPRDSDKPDQLQYATPMPPKVGSPTVPMPYVLFGACVIPLVIGVLLMSAGTGDAGAFGMALAVPSAIGAIVLPVVSQMREK